MTSWRRCNEYIANQTGVEERKRWNWNLHTTKKDHQQTRDTSPLQPYTRHYHLKASTKERNAQRARARLRLRRSGESGYKYLNHTTRRLAHCVIEACVCVCLWTLRYRQIFAASLRPPPGLILGGPQGMGVRYPDRAGRCAQTRCANTCAAARNEVRPCNFPPSCGSECFQFKHSGAVVS